MPENVELGGKTMEGTKNRGREESDKGREKEKGEMSILENRGRLIRRVILRERREKGEEEGDRRK